MCVPHIPAIDPHAVLPMGWEEACKICPSRWVPGCHHGLEFMAQPIQVDMQRLAALRRARHRAVVLDEAVIYVRCFMGERKEYGLLPYSVYTHTLPQSVRRIGILSQALPPGCGGRSRTATCDSACGSLILDLQRFLHSSFPQACHDPRS